MSKLKSCSRPRQYGSSLPVRSEPLKRGGRVKPRNAKRRQAEFPRTYHSVERVQFVQSLPCAACGLYGTELQPIQNAHVIDDGTKGAGRKSGYRCIAPLLTCVHQLLHTNPAKFAQLYPDFDPERAAAETEYRWQQFTAAQRGRPGA